jgi:AraC-like DNA-binding protein
VPSAVRTFTDPDDFAATIRAGRVEITVTGRGHFAAKITRINLHRLWLQRLSDNLPRIAHAAQATGRAVISFRTRPGPPQLWDGVEMHPSMIMRASEAQNYFQQSSGAASSGHMSLPIADIASVGEAAGVDLTPPRYAIMVTPPPAAMARLQRLHAAAGDLAESTPEIIANPHAARGLGQALVAAMVDCLGDRQERETRVAQGQHAIVMRRFRRIIEENPEEPIFIPEICKAIRVSERCLRVCCQEHLGMSPKRYLMLRRMGLARRALRAAATDETTVTDVATRYGFWQLGRFAVEYGSLFAETPSMTLQRRPD